MELLKELRRNSQKSYGSIPTLTPFNDDIFHQTLENIEDSMNQVKILGAQENNLKNLENDGLDLSVTRPNIRDSQEDDDENDDNENEPENQVLNIKEELELMIKVKLDDINHNLRCLHTYQHIRTSRLKEIKWQTGITKLPASLNNCLSKNEQAWYRSNIQNVHKFMSRAEIRHLDLTTDLEPPSTVNIVTVKCNEDLGQVMLSNGVSVTFERNMIYSFPKNVIEKYVRLGQLEVV